MKLIALILIPIFISSCSQPEKDIKAGTDSLSQAGDTNATTVATGLPQTTADGYRMMGDSVLLPSFSIQLKLSAAAEEKLKAAGETVVMSATFEGIPKDTTDSFYHKWGYTVAGAQQIELRNERTAVFDKVKLSRAGYDSLASKDLTVSIDIFSGRHSTENNLLDCDYLEEPLSKVRKQPTILSGKLIGE